jgi:hypothetical protein
MIIEVGQGRMLAGLEQTARSVRWSARVCVLAIVPALSVSSASLARAQSVPRRGADDRQLEQTQREEGEAILALADAAMAGKPVPSDFRVQWRNDFVKAQRGTFVPFTLTVDPTELNRRLALVYVRATRRSMLSTVERSDRNGRNGRSDASRDRTNREETAYPVDAIFPVELGPAGGEPSRISRGFSVPPGEYDVFVVVRERVDPSAPRTRPKAAVVRQPLSVPDFRTGELTTSSVILADRLDVLAEPVPADQLAERPYAIGRNEITPAVDRRFRRDEELIVVFLVYNPMVTPERQFDVRVEYHFYRKVEAGQGPLVDASAAAGAPPPGRAGEQYFNRTDPQRFNPALMGTAFDPGSGEPVMAGQVVPLAGFEVGDYRLAVQVIDLLSGKSVSRDVLFTVGSEP